MDQLSASTVLIDQAPDYENYDYASVLVERGIEDGVEKELPRRSLRTTDSCLELGFGRAGKVLEPYFKQVVMLELARRGQ